MPFILGAMVADVLEYWEKVEVEEGQGTLRVHVATRRLGAQWTSSCSPSNYNLKYGEVVDRVRQVELG